MKACIQITLILSPSSPIRRRSKRLRFKFNRLLKGSESDAHSESAESSCLDIGTVFCSVFFESDASLYVCWWKCCCGGGSLSRHTRSLRHSLVRTTLQTLLCSLASSKKDNHQKSLRETTRTEKTNRSRNKIYFWSRRAKSQQTRSRNLA
jgi:hypothetical protein